MTVDSSSGVAQRAADLIAARDRAGEAAAERRARAVRERVAAAVRAELGGTAGAWLIGSLAWGGFGAHSDIDLVLQGGDPEVAARVERAAARAGGVEVEVLLWEELPRPFQRRIEEEGVPI